MFSGSIIILMILSQAISYTAIPVGSNLPSSDYLQVKTHYQITLAIRERKLASRILRDIQDPGRVNGKLAKP